jgi:hypothetical protein
LVVMMDSAAAPSVGGVGECPYLAVAEAMPLLAPVTSTALGLVDVVMDGTPSQCSSRRGESLLEPRRLPVRGSR